MRSPVPSGEKGLTFAHIRASLREIADLPSSSKNTGPCALNKKEKKHETSHIFSGLTYINLPNTHLYSVTSETGQLNI